MYITANVPISDRGTATLGIMVADRLRRNRKITIHTSPMVSISSNSTSFTDAWMLVVMSRSVEIALGGIHAGLGQRRAYILHVETVRRQLGGIHLHPHRGFLATADAHQSYTAQLRNARRLPRIHQVLNLRERQSVGR